MKKFFKIIIINFIVFIILFFICDYIVYFIHLKLPTKEPKLFTKYGYFYEMPYYTKNLGAFFTGEDYMGRKPDGLEYSNKKPIVVFGCSYAYGLGLAYNQTFSYKLAHILKRPVYNRAMPGGGFQHMYYQVVDYGNKDFFNDIPDVDTVIYIMISHHFSRLILNYFTVLSPWSLMTYSYKNGKFKINNNKFINILKSTYIVKYLNQIYTYKKIYNFKYIDKYTDISVKFFELTRNKLEEHYKKKINFYVIIFETENLPHNILFTYKLRNKGFKVISSYDLTKENLNLRKYKLKNDIYHPNEAAWDILTPLIAEKIKETD